MGDRNDQAVQQSLFGKNERNEQLRRLVFPDGLRDKAGHTVSSNALKSVLLAIDDRDQGGAGGKGCYASIETLCQFANVKRRTCLRALEVLEEVCGFVTRERGSEGRLPTVHRRICWPAIRAFNDGEGLATECPKSATECPTGHRLSAPRGTQNVSLKREKQKSLKGREGLLDLWRGGKLNAGDLDDDDRLCARFPEAVSAGVVLDCAADRLAFVAWGLYCRREGRDPPGLFTSGLTGKTDNHGRTWRQKPTQADEEQARRLLKRRDGHWQPAARGQPSAGSSPLSIADRIRRMYRETEPSLLKLVARKRLNKGSPEYREFITALDAGGLDVVPDDLVLRIFGGKNRPLTSDL